MASMFFRHRNPFRLGDRLGDIFTFLWVFIVLRDLLVRLIILALFAVDCDGIVFMGCLVLIMLSLLGRLKFM